MSASRRSCNSTPSLRRTHSPPCGPQYASAALNATVTAWSTAGQCVCSGNPAHTHTSIHAAAIRTPNCMQNIAGRCKLGRMKTGNHTRQAAPGAPSRSPSSRHVPTPSKTVRTGALLTASVTLKGGKLLGSCMPSWPQPLAEERSDRDAMNVTPCLCQCSAACVSAPAAAGAGSTLR